MLPILLLFGVWVPIVCVIVIAIPLRNAHVSVWRTFFAFMPGLSVLRDPKRIIYAFDLAAALVTGMLMASTPAKSRLRLAIAGLVLALLVTRWNPYVFAFERPTNVFARWVEAPIATDPSCKSFFVTDASDAYESRYFHQWSLYGVDATFIAMRTGIPTLNGYSAWMPDNWDLMNPQLPTYLDSVKQWIALKNLHDVCALDIDRRTMRPFTQ